MTMTADPNVVTFKQLRTLAEKTLFEGHENTGAHPVFKDEFATANPDAWEPTKELMNSVGVTFEGLRRIGLTIQSGLHPQFYHGKEGQARRDGPNGPIYQESLREAKRIYANAHGGISFDSRVTNESAVCGALRPIVFPTLTKGESTKAHHVKDYLTRLRTWLFDKENEDDAIVRVIPVPWENPSGFAAAARAVPSGTNTRGVNTLAAGELPGRPQAALDHFKKVCAGVVTAMTTMKTLSEKLSDQGEWSKCSEHFDAAMLYMETVQKKVGEMTLVSFDPTILRIGDLVRITDHARMKVIAFMVKLPSGTDPALVKCEVKEIREGSVIITASYNGITKEQTLPRTSMERLMPNTPKAKAVIGVGDLVLYNEMQWMVTDVTGTKLSLLYQADDGEELSLSGTDAVEAKDVTKV